MAGILKRDVKTEEVLLDYLGEQANRATRFYHYTTYDTLLAILHGKSFRLSKTYLLNDKKEREFSGDTDCFVMSMSTDKEYVSMWSMYGRPSGIKIRIDFDPKLFKVCFKKERIYEDPELRIRYFPTTKPLFDDNIEYCSLKDVVYLDKTRTEYRHRGDPFSGITASESGIKKLGGFIKYDAWEFEREIRAKVLVWDKPDVDYVYVSLTDELIKSIRVTFNPWISKNMKKEISQALSKHGISCIDSGFDGQVDELP